MDRITRKELKSDRFALEVEHSVDYVNLHRKPFIQWGAIALGVILLLAAIFWYRGYQHSARQEALSAALRVQNASVGSPQNEFALSYPTDAEKKAASNKAFTELAAKYPNSEEGSIAEYYLGAAAADKGDLAQAEKRFKLVVDGGEKAYASLAKLSLAQIYQAQGKLPEAENVLKSVMDQPTVLVSKEEAVIALAHVMATSKPQEARKLLEPLRSSQRSAISRAALTALSDIPQK